MGSRTRLANDPYFQQGISDLAKAFAPPSGSDLYGYSKAAETKQAVEARARYLGLDPSDPKFKSLADQFAIFEGKNPNYYQIDSTNATSLQNNAMDNATNRANNAADNRTKFAQTRYGAVGQNQVLPDLPQSVAAMFGLPASGVVSGNISVNQGEKVVTPDGREIQGNAKPLSATEWEAQESDRLKREGKLTDADLRAKVMGSTPTEQIYDEKGNPVNVYRSDSVGKPPVQKNTTMTIGPDGNPIYTTTTSPGGGKLTEVQGKYALFATRADQANKLMQEMLIKPDGSLTPYGEGFSSGGGALDYIASMGKTESPTLQVINNMVKTPEGQKYYQAAQNFLTTILRPDTGAAVTPEEFQTYGAIFIPMPGDSAEVVKNKNDARRVAASGLQALSNGGAALIAQQLVANGLPVPPELQRYVGSTPSAPQQVQPAAPPAGGEIKWIIKDGKLVKQ